MTISLIVPTFQPDHPTDRSKLHVMFDEDIVNSCGSIFRTPPPSYSHSSTCNIYAHNSVVMSPITPIFKLVRAINPNDIYATVGGILMVDSTLLRVIWTRLTLSFAVKFQTILAWLFPFANLDRLFQLIHIHTNIRSYTRLKTNVRTIPAFAWLLWVIKTTSKTLTWGQLYQASPELSRK